MIGTTRGNVKSAWTKLTKRLRKNILICLWRGTCGRPSAISTRTNSMAAIVGGANMLAKIVGDTAKGQINAAAVFVEATVHARGHASLEAAVRNAGNEECFDVGANTRFQGSKIRTPNELV